ncbi:hypothetical protein KUTeg_015262 [Tegillarca granosa]|uniref:Uncharacterized protein n=1 Tax=Tegillarca granosa TaxID=220873 RepID=A0ABQ9EPL6_TEGGR|nr:hypothetical protein KUTeg_015262 [Tegillarca granosa]
MATTAKDFRSPFNNVLSSLPQGHDKAFKQALYTTAANLFVLFAFAAAIALYFILEAFLRPLLWAVLCGTFLYPFKRSLTNSLRTWLIGLQKSGTPFIIGVITIPVHTVDKTYETISFEFTKHVKLIFSAICGILCLYFLWHFGPVKLIFSGLQSSFMFVYELLGYFTSFWLWTIVIGYILAVAFLWTPDLKKYLLYLSFPVWILIILHIATVAGFLRVPLLIFLVVVVTIGFIAEVKEAGKQKELQGKTDSPSAVETAWMILTGAPESIKEETDAAEAEGVPGEQKEESTKTETSDAEKIKEREIQKPTSLPVRKLTTPSKPPTSEGKTTSTSAAEAIKKAETEEKSKLTPLQTQSKTSSDKTKVARSLSDQCFIGLFWALVLSRLWLHIWIIQLLLPIGFLLWLVKFLGYRIGSLGDRFHSVKDKVWSWLYSRRDVFAPRWIRGLIKMISRGDSKVQQESMHLVKMTSNLLNNTLHPEMSQ